MEQTNILLAESDCFIRHSLSGYLSEQGYSVYDAPHAGEAVSLARRHPLSAAIVNIVLAPTAEQKRLGDFWNVGLALIQQLKQIDPELGIVILSACTDRGAEVLELLRSMRGLVYRVRGLRDPVELLDALHMAMLGNVWIDPAVQLSGSRSESEALLDLCAADERPLVRMALSRLDQLTPAEVVVLTHVGHSRSTKGIAQEIGVAPATVESHVNHIYAKLFGAAADGDLRRSVLLAKVALFEQIRRDEAKEL